MERRRDAAIWVCTAFAQKLYVCQQSTGNGVLTVHRSNGCDNPRAAADDLDLTADPPRSHEATVFLLVVNAAEGVTIQRDLRAGCSCASYCADLKQKTRFCAAGWCNSGVSDSFAAKGQISIVQLNWFTEEAVHMPIPSNG
jgi:hypothetical protein